MLPPPSFRVNVRIRIVSDPPDTMAQMPLPGFKQALLTAISDKIDESIAAIGVNSPREKDQADDRCQHFARVIEAALPRMNGKGELFVSPKELRDIAYSVGAFGWMIGTDKGPRAERRAFGAQCERFRGQTFNVRGKRIDFNAIGVGHARQYRIAARH
jgi:hypothetical protein